MIEGTKMKGKRPMHHTEESFDYWADYYQAHPLLQSEATFAAFMFDPRACLAIVFNDPDRQRDIECSLPGDDYLPLLPAQQLIFVEAIADRLGNPVR